jgi:hypothetical protein
MQDKFESLLEIIESVVSSPFVKAEADSVQWYENTDLELFVQKCYKSREKYVK